jgi:ketopantoate reductase
MVIVGRGRVGGALADAAAARGLAAAVVGRVGGDAALADPGAGPLLVCTRNDDLPSVIARVPAARRPDLVFVQNGMLRTFLAGAGLAGAGRGLLRFAVARRGEPPVPGGDSVFTGPHAEAVVAFLVALGLPARAVSAEAFAGEELEKLVWNCALGLLGDALDLPVGPIARDHADALGALVEELAALGAPAVGLAAPPPGLFERVVAYSLEIGDYRASVKEWPWRNGWFEAEAARAWVATPVHEAWLRRVPDVARG